MKFLTPENFLGKNFKRISFVGLVIASVCQLQGCNHIGFGDDRGKTLAVLPEAKIPSGKAKVEVLDITRIEQSYQRALAVAEEPALRQQIMVRIADLEMHREIVEGEQGVSHGGGSARGRLPAGA